MDDSNREVVQLGIEYDPQSESNVAQATDRVVQQLGRLSDTTNDTDEAVQALRDSLTSSMDTAKDSITNVDKVVQNLRDSLKEANAEAVKTEKTTQNLDPNFSGGVSGLRRSAGALSQLGLPQVGAPIAKIAEIAQIDKTFSAITEEMAKVGNEGTMLTGVLGQMGGNMAIVGVAGPIAALAIGGVAIAFQQLQDIMKSGDILIKEGIANIDKFYQISADTTSKQAENQIESLEKIKQSSIAEATTLADSLNSLEQQTGIRADIIAKTDPAVQAMIDRFNQLNDTTDKTSGEIQAYTDYINDNGAAAADAAAAQKAYTVEINKQLDQQAANAKEIRTGSLKSAQDEVADINERLSLINDAATEAFNSGNTDAFGNLMDQAQKLQDREKDLTDTIIPAIQARDDETQAIKNFTDNAKAAWNDLQKLTSNQKNYNDQTQIIQEQRSEQDALALKDFHTTQREETTAFYTDLAKKDEAFADKKAKDTAKLYADVSKMDKQEQDNELKVQQQLAEQEVQNAQNLQNQIAQIRSQALYDERDAAVNLDAKRIADDQRKEKQQVQQAVVTSDNQKKQLEDQEKIRLADMKKSAEQAHNQRLADGLQSIQDQQEQYNEQRQNDVQNFNDKLATEQQHFNDTQARTDANRAIEDQKREIAFNNEQTALERDMGQKLGIQNAGQTKMQASSNSFWDTITAYAASKIASIPAPSTQTSSTSTSAPVAISSGDYAQQAGQYYNDTVNYSPNSGFTYSSDNLTSVGVQLGSDNKSNNYNNFAGYNGYAKGGDPVQGEKAWVGENGPELVEFKQPAHVYNAASSRQMGGDTYFDKIADKIEINGSSLGPDELQDAVEEGIMQFYRKVAAKKSGNAMRRLS